MSKGSSIARCGNVPQYVRRRLITIAGVPQLRVTQIGDVRVDAKGQPRSKSFKSVYGRTPRRLRERGLA